MAGIKHSFTSGKADGVDPTLVRPSNWNADHVVTGDFSVGGFKVTGIGVAATLGDALSYGRAAYVAAPFLVNSSAITGSVIDARNDTNGPTNGVVRNEHTGTIAHASLIAANLSHYAMMRMYGTGFTTVSSDRQDGMLLYTNGAGGMTFNCAAAAGPNNNFAWEIHGNTFMSLTDSAGLRAYGGFQATHGLFSGSGGGGTVTCTGFGVQSVLDIDGSIVSTSGNGIRMICVSAGVILSNGASSWAAISDYRAKNVAGEFTNSGEIIDAVPVHLAALKSTPENVKAMFLAHEVQAAVPYAVNGEKDALNANGDPLLQYLESTDPLVPIMWAEIRALRARLAALEAAP